MAASKLWRIENADDLRAIKIAPDNIEIVFMGSLLSPEPNRVEIRDTPVGPVD